MTILKEAVWSETLLNGDGDDAVSDVGDYHVVAHCSGGAVRGEEGSSAEERAA